MIVTVLSHCVPQNGDTALILASLNGKTEVVRELLSGGAKVDLQTEVRQHQLLTIHCILKPYYIQ